ncbi:Glutamate 5-kinase [Pseudoalteromonas luteoviolacea B = ATCC 29581]|nr:Glutamate 5-kinase [Pseudoalteromonas luteoviolacea B = ATCC 29581]
MSSKLKKRLVLKIGSALIAPMQDGCRSENLLRVAQFIVDARNKDYEVILVSSGAVAAGSHHFAKDVERSLAVKKAMAAAGQTAMMAMWDRFFDFPCAQLLLTHADLRNRDRFTSFRQTLFTLLEQGILPIINENDAVATNRLKVGDNDNLSAMVASAADANTLILCTDVDGLFDKNPNLHADATLVKEVPLVNDELIAATGGATSSVGTGGMKTKLEAAQKATSHGITTFIVNGFKDETFKALIQGENPGTKCAAYEKPLKESIHWLTHTSAAQGELVVPHDAAEEMKDQNGNIRCDELQAVAGDFSAGETVLIKDEKGNAIAKAKSNYSSCLLNFIAQHQEGLFTSQMQDSIGPIISQQDIAVLEK